jgi:N-acetyl-gamma-glutamylphosphate reductase
MISGVFAGRSAKEANLYTEIAEGIHAYGITKHRHGTNHFTLFIP